MRAGDRAAWKDPAHPLRVDPALKLTRLPTLIHWTPIGAGMRDEGKLEAAGTEEEARKVAEVFVQSTPYDW